MAANNQRSGNNDQVFVLNTSCWVLLLTLSAQIIFWLKVFRYIENPVVCFELYPAFLAGFCGEQRCTLGCSGI